MLYCTTTTTTTQPTIHSDAELKLESKSRKSILQNISITNHIEFYSVLSAEKGKPFIHGVVSFSLARNLKQMPSTLSLPCFPPYWYCPINRKIYNLENSIMFCAFLAICGMYLLILCNKINCTSMHGSFAYRVSLTCVTPFTTQKTVLLRFGIRWEIFGSTL